MKLKLLLLTFLTGACFLSYGQTPYNEQENFLKANSVWVFGSNNGVDFNTIPPTAFSSQIFSNEGSASVSDPVTGELLFYSDGAKCWNKNGQVMPNGDGLWGNQRSTTQGVCIVPVIDSPGKYYLFSLFGPTQYGSSTNPTMLSYSIVDMSEQSGLGDVVSGRKNIVLTDDSLSESMIAVPGANCDLWLLVHEYQNPVFRAYHITAEGIDTVPVVSSGIGQIQGVFAFNAGQMAISPDRSKVAIASFNGDGFQKGTVVAEFNPSTGEVTNPITLALDESCYGLAFSPDNSKLYVSGFFDNGAGGIPAFRSHVRQYDLSTYDSTAIVTSAQLVDSSVERAAASYLKLYNGKIYRYYQPDGWPGLLSGMLGLSCINSPDLAGAACDYNTGNVIPLLSPGASTLSLPNDVVYPLPPDTLAQLAIDTAFCATGSITLEGDAGFGDYLWDDGSASQTRQVSQSGTYWVLNVDRCHSRVDTFVVEIYDFITPVISVDGFILRTTASYASYQWLLNGAVIAGATQPEYTVLENGDYQVIITTADGCTDTSAIYEVTNVGISDRNLLAGQVSIYPNPASGVIYIQSPVQVDVALCSVEGKTLESLRSADRISLTGLAAGIYLLKIYDQHGRLIRTEKIIRSL